MNPMTEPGNGNGNGNGDDPNQRKPWRNPNADANAVNASNSGPVDATPAADLVAGVGDLASGAIDAAGAAASGALEAGGEVLGGAVEAAGGCADGCGSCSLALVILGFIVANTAFAIFR
jgi:hypothetical protein